MTNLNRVFVLCIILIIITWNCIASCSADPLNAEQKRDRVGKLPGQDFNVSFAHYSGYITVNKKSGREFFYWFFEAVEDPASKPLVLWLSGGPGCSSIAQGEHGEIGPFRANADGKSISLNPYSWTQAANIIFLESPAGVGFSYSNTPSDSFNNGDGKTAADNLAFILKWLDRFPQYKKRDLYIAGENYAGHYVPQLSQAKLEHRSAINLKGILLGVPLLDDKLAQKGMFDYMYSICMISEETRDLLKEDCEDYLDTSGFCQEAKYAAGMEIGDIDLYSVFTPVCNDSTSTASSNMLSKRWPVGLLKRNYDPCFGQHSLDYFNLREVQEALHVKGSPVNWQYCRMYANLGVIPLDQS